jgi:DNA polymerase III alpha subunit
MTTNREFRTGCLARGIKPDTIRLIWEMMLSFAGYSFCKPHSGWMSMY